MSLDTEMAEQIVKLNEKNKVLKKALELACEWMSRYCIPCPPLKDCPSVECSQSKSDCYYRYFIQQAKESLDAEN